MSTRSPISTKLAGRVSALRASRRPASPSNLNNIKPWFDETTYPTIVDAVVRCAATREQQAFQCTSRYWRKRVDVIRSMHLVLDGELYSDFPRRLSTNLLHDGKRAYFFNEANYSVYSSDTDSDMAFTLPAMDVSRTRVFDVRGQVRQAVLDDLAALLTSLDTLRVYAYYERAHQFEISLSDRFTAFWGQNFTAGPGRERTRLPTSKPKLPRAKRLVVFSHLGQYDQWTFKIPVNPLPAVPPGVKHLVVRLAVPSEPSMPLAGFARKFTPLPELKCATIIFSPTDRRWRKPKKRNKVNTLADLQTVVEALGVPVTVVGFDLLERRIQDAKNKLTGVTFADTRAYRAEVGEEDWALFTREAEGVDLLHRQHIWSDMLHR
ncbi:hypothetical protein CcaverHIS002_0600160 [Cutaneotrichosporon cavernicola]|uniref:Uncharacterized protein n=1 Tax=Cutaneotrichosporon cavernicola TaxID=279322 RepID=A0AA48L5M2_9TREE|nr:uncharacterized protein CcaverHIS019_0500250 [Cutaneotrichosporon cavernicola]BEI85729.1 hypothetical protein CcaverHIS002_0600160 [Cutaneotrichosporon cavernicola]BEI92397.1 hypothetical protein CcaverHIS019_0500250 [Cutaneotrichosporon cavernicola]BEJ00170.1 hypothetical protein CcaverHIS631_0500270 [Cutaneotrichosporon cavernicola]BEJ07941.1 hypothetical protein CcaverHIS641_0500260 [Cutaneotrichosporon cavernicola]